MSLVRSRCPYSVKISLCLKVGYVSWWVHGDLNPGSSPCKGDVITELDYEPTCHAMVESFKHSEISKPYRWRYMQTVPVEMRADMDTIYKILEILSMYPSRG